MLDGFCDYLPRDSRARSTGPAIFAGGWALRQLWMFWVAPLIGGALGGGLYNILLGESTVRRIEGAW
jgi:hypothetical protein